MTSLLFAHGALWLGIAMLGGLALLLASLLGGKALYDGEGEMTLRYTNAEHGSTTPTVGFVADAGNIDASLSSAVVTAPA